MLPTPTEAWQSCLEIIQDNINGSSFQAWFAPIKPVDLVQNDEEIRFTVELPSRFFYEWLEEHYYKLLNTTIAKILGPESRLYYKVIIVEQEDSGDSDSMRLPARPSKGSGPGFRMPTVAEPRAAAPSQAVTTPPLVAVDPKLNKNYTFDNFIEGDCNRLARSAALAIAKNPGGTSFNPFLIYGGVGLGKTHLIQAIGNGVLANDASKRIRFLSSERFTNDFVHAIQQNEISRFSKFYRSIDVLIIDDVQFFGGKEKTQEEFFHVFNELHQIGKQIILSADRPPSEIKGIEARLLSRFGWGLTADLQVPELETRLAILYRKAADEGLDLPPDVIDYMARNVKSNIRELEGALVRLMALSTLQTDEVDMTMAKAALKDLIHYRPASLSIDRIQQIVCEYFDMDQDLVRAKTRKREVVQPRQIAMFFCKELTQNSLKTIGLQFGGRDHSTVIYANRSVSNQMETNPQYREMVDQIRQCLIDST